MNAAQLQALARAQLASPSEFAQSLEKALREHEGKRLRAEQEEAQGAPELRALKGMRLLNQHANMVNQMQVALPPDLANNFTWATGAGAPGVKTPLQAVTYVGGFPARMCPMFSPTAQSMDPIFGQAAQTQAFPAGEHSNSLQQQAVLTPRTEEHLRENLNNMLGKIEVKLGADQLIQVVGPSAANGVLADKTGEDDGEDGDTVQRRRAQNREASARFRARGKARDQELLALKNEVSRLEKRNNDLKNELEQFRPSSSPLTQKEILFIQESTMKWVMTKFRLKRKITLRAVAMSVLRTTSLYSAVQRKQSGGGNARMEPTPPAPAAPEPATTSDNGKPSAEDAEMRDEPAAAAAPPLKAAFAIEEGDPPANDEGRPAPLPPPIKTRQLVTKAQPVRTSGVSAESPRVSAFSPTASALNRSSPKVAAAQRDAALLLKAAVVGACSPKTEAMGNIFTPFSPKEAS